MKNRIQKMMFQHIDEMHAIATHLVPYTWPKVPYHQEHDVDILKRRILTVDGYRIATYFSISDYEEYRVETFEVVALYSPFLPMYLVCKIAAEFLGGHELAYCESFKLGRKSYIWEVAVDERGRPLPLDNPKLKHCSYEGFDYSCIGPNLLEES